MRRALEQVPGMDLERAIVSPLTGGITNRNYRVEHAGETYVLRLGGESTRFLGIDRRREHAASAVAAALGVGAEVVCFLEAEEALVTRFVSGQAVSPSALREPHLLERAVASIRRYHDGSPFPGKFSVFETVRAYHRLAAEHGVAFPASVPAALTALRDLERALGAPRTLVPCHNDLLAANFIDDGATLRILDWEYAAMGDPFFDLGNFAANQELDREGCALLLELYSGGVREEDEARLHLLRLASDLRESFWGFLQAGISSLDFDFPGYARAHLDRFQLNAAVPEFPRWLERATHE